MDVANTFWIDTFWKIATSEFLWGIVVGLLVAFAGAWLQAWVTHRQQRSDRRELIKLFCLDVIHNLQRYAAEIGKIRQHAKIVPKRVLVLIDHELLAYGRQRDFLVLINQPTRDGFRDLMNDIAIKRAEVQHKLEQVEDIFARANSVDAAGDATKAKRIRDDADLQMKELGVEADSLVSIINGATKIVAKLQSI